MVSAVERFHCIKVVGAGRGLEKKRKNLICVGAIIWPEVSQVLLLGLIGTQSTGAENSITRCFTLHVSVKSNV